MSSFGMMVYGPEVARSGLTAELDTFIEQQSGLEISQRFFAVHNRSSIEEFYALTGSTGGRHWPLVLDLFDLRPACVTLWAGSNALCRLQALKGKTHPGQAAKGTIRSRFYCDNPVTNLVHVSDDEVVMGAELAILRNRITGYDAANWTGTEMDARPLSHSSFRVLLGSLGGDVSASFQDGNGDAFEHARASMERAEVLAKEQGIAETLERFFLGDATSVDEITSRAPRLSGWDRLILEAGLFAMPTWHALLRPTHEASAGVAA